MKKLLGLSLSLVLALPLIAVAQSSMQDNSRAASAQSQGANDSYGQNSAAANAVKGTISQDGKTLVGDDGKSWTIANPEAVKGHEGHHVMLTGSADANTNQIQVASVKMTKDKGSKKGATQ